MLSTNSGDCRMNNVSLLPFAGFVLGGYSGVKIYDYLTYERIIAVHATWKLLAVAGGASLIGLIIGAYFMVKIEEM